MTQLTNFEFPHLIQNSFKKAETIRKERSHKKFHKLPHHQAKQTKIIPFY
uniref:Uncharacterized protein n=1 Tax=Rhizophora mucronata TaxID=61149 RepID=A0A2P2KJ94_RHIMU